MSKCYTTEAKSFENKLYETGITFSQFQELRTIWHELSPGGQAEVNDMLQDNSNTEEWIDVTKALPPVNVMVKVLLTNNTEALDFVNLPLDKETPFQHYIVAKWRMATRDELNEFMAKANRAR